METTLILGFAATALGGLAIAAFVVIKMYTSAAAFQGSAVRFADAIDARATAKAAAMRPREQPQEPIAPPTGMPAYVPGLDLPPMPEEIQARWRERTVDSNVPDRWPTAEDA